MMNNNEKEDWFGKVRWCNEDIKAAMEGRGIDPSQEDIFEIRNKLEHHSFTDHMISAGWDFINQVIDNYVDSYRICSCCNKRIYSGFTDEDKYWCEECFEKYMNSTFGKENWRARSDMNICGGFYDVKDTETNKWIPLNLYWTEWNN